MIVRSREQDVQRDFVRRLLPLCAFHQGDHAIEKCFTRVRRDLHPDLIGEHARASRDRRAIASRFANHRRGFAGDRRLVHRSDAFENLAIGRNQFARRDQAQIAGAQLRTGNFFDLAIRLEAVRDGFRPRLAQRVGLRFAATFRHGLRKVREQHSEPQPERDLQVELERTARRGTAARRDDAADLDHEHDRIAHHLARIQFDERIDNRPSYDLHFPQCFLCLP